MGIIPAPYLSVSFCRVLVRGLELLVCSPEGVAGLDAVDGVDGVTGPDPGYRLR